jgi:uncharacterized protein (TIGR02246 family)
MKKYLLLILLVVAPFARGEENKATHDELRALRDRLLTALNKGDLDTMVSQLATNCVVTWQNGEVSRGRDGFRRYYDRMMTAPGHIVESFTTSVNVDELTILYGDDTGIAFGSSDDHFKLKGGLDVPLHDRWTATVVKEDGQWRIASIHVSANVFDNPLLSATKRTLTWAVPVAGIAGLLVGLFLGKRRKA